MYFTFNLYNPLYVPIHRKLLSDCKEKTVEKSFFWKIEFIMDSFISLVFIFTTAKPFPSVPTKRSLSIRASEVPQFTLPG